MFAFEEASYALVLEDANGKPEPFDDAGFLFARSDLPAKAALVLGLEAMRGVVRVHRGLQSMPLFPRHLFLTAPKKTLQPFPCRHNGKSNDRHCGSANQQSKDT
jgi:hypothetical protein